MTSFNPNLGWPEWAWRGLAEGWCKPLGGATLSAELSGTGRNKCSRPVERTLRFDNSPVKSVTRAYVRLVLRCRACEACLRQRRSDWTARATHEVSRAERTWFVTLTFNPHTRFAIMLDAKKRAGSLEIWHKSSVREQQNWLRLAAQRYLTLYLKRLRKDVRTKRGPATLLRYMAIFEAHQDGTPHIHMLLHEYGGGVRLREIKENWGSNGFAQASLVADGDPGRAARYCVKYLTKDAHRVRASIRYGEVPAVEDFQNPFGKALTSRDVPPSSEATPVPGVPRCRSQEPATVQSGESDDCPTYRRWRFNRAMYYAPELARQGREERQRMSDFYIRTLELLDGEWRYVNEPKIIGSMALSKPSIFIRRDVQSSRTGSGCGERPAECARPSFSGRSGLVGEKVQDMAAGYDAENSADSRTARADDWPPF